MSDPRRSALLLLHITVFVWGWTGILGKVIQQPTLHLVLTRTVIGLMGLVAVALWTRRSLSLHTPDLKHYLLTGLIILAHWITFYGAIKVSTASIAAACLSTSTVFTALLEPLWFKRKMRLYEVVLGVVVVAALLLMFGLEPQYRSGIAIATLSALLSAWFNVVNGRLVKRGDPLRIGFYEMLSVTIALGLWLVVTNDLPAPFFSLPARDIGGYIALGLVCTTFAFIAGIAVMKQLSPFTVILTVNLEPVYTILIALLLWPETERMHPGSYAGIALILACLFLNGWWQRRLDARPGRHPEVTEPDPLAQG